MAAYGSEEAARQAADAVKAELSNPAAWQIEVQYINGWQFQLHTANRQISLHESVCGKRYYCRVRLATGDRRDYGESIFAKAHRQCHFSVPQIAALLAIVYCGTIAMRLQRDLTELLATMASIDGSELPPQQKEPEKA